MRKAHRGRDGGEGPAAPDVGKVLRVEGRMLAARADGAGSQFEDCIGLYEMDVSDAVVSLLDEECINREGDNNA